MGRARDERSGKDGEGRDVVINRYGFDWIRWSVGFAVRWDGMKVGFEGCESVESFHVCMQN